MIAHDRINQDVIYGGYMSSGDIGKQIILLRETAGISQKDLAEKISVTQPSLSRWESGVVVPPLHQIERIAGALGLSLEEVLSEDKEEYEKLRKKLLASRLVSLVLAILLVVVIILVVMPKYRVIAGPEVSENEYGASLEFYVKPIFFFTESGSEAYAKKLAKQYSDRTEYETIDVVFVKSSADYYDWENTYYSIYYFLDTLTN